MTAVSAAASTHAHKTSANLSSQLGSTRAPGSIHALISGHWVHVIRCWPELGVDWPVDVSVLYGRM